jgi:hypothetical protein
MVYALQLQQCRLSEGEVESLHTRQVDYVASVETHRETALSIPYFTTSWFPFRESKDKFCKQPLIMKDPESAEEQQKVKLIPSGTLTS